MLIIKENMQLRGKWDIESLCRRDPLTAHLLRRVIRTDYYYMEDKRHTKS